MTDERIMLKREMILKAALEIFAEKGFHRAKIEDIALSAGIGKGTVYEYFTSKEQLFMDMLKEGLEKIDQNALEEIARQQTSIDKIRCMVRLNIEMGRRYEKLTKIVMTEHPILDEAFHKFMIRIFEQRLLRIEKIITDGIAGGELRPCNIKISAHLLMGGLAFIINPLTGNGVDDLTADELMNQMLDFFFNGIAQKNI